MARAVDREGADDEVLALVWREPPDEQDRRRCVGRPGPEPAAGAEPVEEDRDHLRVGAAELGSVERETPAAASAARPALQLALGERAADAAAGSSSQKNRAGVTLCERSRKGLATPPFDLGRVARVVHDGHALRVVVPTAAAPAGRCMPGASTSAKSLPPQPQAVNCCRQASTWLVTASTGPAPHDQSDRTVH